MRAAFPSPEVLSVSVGAVRLRHADRTVSVSWTELRAAADQDAPGRGADAVTASLAEAYRASLAEAERMWAAELRRRRIATLSAADAATWRALQQEVQRVSLYARALAVADTPAGGWGETRQAILEYEGAAGSWTRIQGVERWIVSPDVDEAIRVVRIVEGDGALHVSRVR